MTTDEDFAAKVEASSLGAPAARALRATVDDEHAASLVARSNERMDDSMAREAAAKALFEGLLTFGTCTWEQMLAEDSRGRTRRRWRADASRVIDAYLGALPAVPEQPTQASIGEIKAHATAAAAERYPHRGIIGDAQQDIFRHVFIEGALSVAALVSSPCVEAVIPDRETIAAEERREWAEYLAHRGSHVGDHEPSLAEVIELLRGPRPFGAADARSQQGGQD